MRQRQAKLKSTKRSKLRKFIEESSFYDVDLRRTIDTESEYVRNVRLDKLNNMLVDK